jgi:hypothetical protein
MSWVDISRRGRMSFWFATPCTSPGCRKNCSTGPPIWSIWCGSHVDAGDWHRLAEEIAPLMAGSDANGNAWQLAALSWQLGMTLADVETLGADDLNILRDCAGSLSPMARGQIGCSPMSVITGSSCSRR